MTFNKRIEHLVNLEKSQAEFARKTGISKGALNRVVKEKGGMSNSSIEQILNSYPGLSARWLLTGEGEMWDEGAQGDLEACREENARLREEVERLKKENKRIYGNIDDIRKLNDYLEKDNDRLLKKLGLK